jgi:YVTN family beta-propeller protein
MSNLPTLNRLTRVVCGLLAAGAITLSLASCGDTFRPIVIPNGTQTPNPGAQREAIVLTETPPEPSDPSAQFPCANGALVIQGAQCPGTMMQISVGGDTNSSTFVAPGDQANYIVGRGPRFGAFGVAFPQEFSMTDRDSDSVTTITPSTGTVNTVSLPAGSQPVFLAVASDPNAPAIASNDLLVTANAGSGSVSFVDASTRTVRLTAPLTTATNPTPHPVSIIGNAALRKIYVVDEGDGTSPGQVIVVSTVDGSILGTIPVGVDPVSVVVSNAAPIAYVVNRGDASISVIDINRDAVASTITTGGGACAATFDPTLLRIYVANCTGNSVSVIDASTIQGGLLRTIPLPAGATNPAGVVALRDGTRFYTVNFATNNVTVFDAQSFAARSNIPVGTHPTFIAASSDSSRVYVTNQDPTLDASGNVTSPPGTTIIRAVASPQATPPQAADTVVTTIPAPFTNPSIDQNICANQPAQCVRQQPVFIAVQ